MKVVWSAQALQHLESVRQYIAKDLDLNATLVAKRILESVELLQTQPGMGRPGRITGTRELVVQNTSYVIHYRVRRNVLELIAVFHGRQRWPKKS